MIGQELSSVDILRMVVMLATLVILFVGVIYVVLGFTLKYHWQKYGLGEDNVRKLKRRYFWVGGSLLLLMLFSYVVILFI